MTMTTRKVSPSETVEARSEYSSGANNVMGNLSNAAVKMEKVEGYTTFLAEYTFQGGDIIIHFFMPMEAYSRRAGGSGPEPKPEYISYWQNKFPQVLSAVAMEYFDATYPRIFAEWVPEMVSWYMKCQGFASRLDPKGYVDRFFELLDSSLDNAGVP